MSLSVDVGDPDKGLDAFLKVTEATGSMTEEANDCFGHRRKGYFRVSYTNSTHSFGRLLYFMVLIY